GFFALENSGFNLDTWGVRVDNFRGMATTTAEGAVSIAASAQTDNGQLAITGNGSGLLQDDLDLSLQLTGDEFQLLNSPDFSARVTPDISLIADSEGISVRGTIQVPHLFIAMGALPETAIDVSSDVVIVNYPADQPQLARSLAAVDNRFMSVPISANLALELGDDVRFAGLGLDTRLQGLLTVEQLANGSNRTFGELAVVAGSYSLYGQTLQLEEGELLFIGPYDNPGLDIRATRDVGDTEVGLQMNGTLRNIQSELFSTPSLPENDIIALLATGRPFSQIGQSDEEALLGSVARLGLARGRVISERVRNSLGLDALAITNTGRIDEAMLTVGKYITPSIFVRYGLGLFDNQSKISVDYDLTQSIKLQAESGENQSLDVTYSIEN
ncbi:MAG: translocation/assembly module TamB domain-containing protein, partial [Pseudomonadales bacterium]|nr:translocation/assembly module TamB domain-containing protein [Pseudomonadales bacterium]